MAAHYTLDVPAGGEQYIRLRLTDYETNNPFNNFDAIIDRRRKEADVFYDALLGDKLSPAQVNIARQCYAGKSSNNLHFVAKVLRSCSKRIAMEQAVLSLCDGRVDAW